MATLSSLLPTAEPAPTPLQLFSTDSGWTANSGAMLHKMGASCLQCTWRHSKGSMHPEIRARRAKRVGLVLSQGPPASNQKLNPLQISPYRAACQQSPLTQLGVTGPALQGPREQCQSLSQPSCPTLLPLLGRPHPRGPRVLAPTRQRASLWSK